MTDCLEHFRTNKGHDSIPTIGSGVLSSQHAVYSDALPQNHSLGIATLGHDIWERQHNPRNRVVVSVSDCLRLAIEGGKLVVQC